MSKPARTKPNQSGPTVQEILTEFQVALRERAWRVEGAKVPILAALDLPKDLEKTETPIGALIARAIQATIPDENEWQVALLKHFGLHSSTRSIRSQPARRQRATDHLKISKYSYSKLLKQKLDDTARTLLMLQPNFESPTSPAESPNAPSSSLTSERSKPDEKTSALPARHETGELFIVNGPSGVSVKKALANYKTFLRHREVLIVSVEEKLPETAIVRASLEPDQPEPSLLEVLQLPRPVLTAAWPEALHKALVDHQAKKVIQRGGIVLLTFHAVLLHLESGRFLWAASREALERELSDLPHPKKVITLIDDVFDCHVRLSRSQQLWNGSFAFRARLGQLETMLEWRQIEIRASQAIADMVDVEHFIFATKHPVDTFDKLIHVVDPKYVYVAHPIGELRRQGLDTPRVNAVVEAIEEVAATLRQRNDVVLFEPTTIDELRSSWPKEKEDGSFQWPRLLEEGLIMDQHWQRNSKASIACLADELLDEEERKKADDWLRLSPSWEGSPPPPGTAIDQEWLSPDDRIEVIEARGAHELVLAEIIQQVNWRDRTLVEQSQSLAQIRPFLKASGACSTGVVEEHRLHRRLRQLQRNAIDLLSALKRGSPTSEATTHLLTLLQTSGALRVAEEGGRTVYSCDPLLLKLAEDFTIPHRFRAIVFHPKEDEVRRRIGGILELCRQEHDTGRVIISADAMEKLHEKLQNTDLATWVAMDNAKKLGVEFQNLLERLAVNPHPELAGKGRKVRTMKGVKSQEMNRGRFRDDLARMIQEVLSGAGSSDDFDLRTFQDTTSTVLIDIEDLNETAGARILRALKKEWEGR